MIELHSFSEAAAGSNVIEGGSVSHSQMRLSCQKVQILLTIDWHLTLCLNLTRAYGAVGTVALLKFLLSIKLIKLVTCIHVPRNYLNQAEQFTLQKIGRLSQQNIKVAVRYLVLTLKCLAFLHFVL